MTTITVTSNSELRDAIDQLEAAGGGRIELENTGSKYNLSGNNFGTEDGTITITSADPDDPAVMSGIRVIDSQNLSFENLTINSEGVDRPNWVKDFMVENGKNISVSDSTFSSTADGTLLETGGDVTRGEDMGFVRGTDGFTFENNVVTNYYNGLALVESNNLNVTGNEFTQIQADGIRGGGIQDAVFKDNLFHDWYGSARHLNHDDMFQIWGTNVDQVSKNILIEGNFFDAGGSTASQTILIQNEHWESEADNYSNIIISNNVIYNGHTHGITVDDTVGVQVLDNTLLYDKQVSTPTGNVSNPPSIRVFNPEGAIVSGNIANEIYVGGEAHTEDNIWVNYDSPSDPNYFDNHIVNIGSGGKGDLRDLELLPDSPWYGYGADASQGDGPQPGVTAVMTQTTVPGEYGTFILDASLSHTADGYLSSDDAIFEWHFEDGTIIEGQSVEVDFEDYGIADVQLVVKTANGDEDTITRGVDVEDSTISRIDFNEGAETSGISFSDVTDANFVEGLEGGGFLLDGDSEAALSKSNSDLYELDQFTIEVALQKVDADDSGKILDFHRAQSLSIREDGSIQFSMETVDGSFSVNTGDIGISDTEWHKISIVYSSYDEELSIWLDGNKLGETHATGETIPYENWGPQLGNPDYKGDSVTAVIDDFAILQKSLEDYEVQEDHIQALSLESVDLDTLYQPGEGYSGSGNSYRSVDPEVFLDIIAQPAPAAPEEEAILEDTPEQSSNESSPIGNDDAEDAQAVAPVVEADPFEALEKALSPDPAVEEVAGENSDELPITSSDGPEDAPTISIAPIEIIADAPLSEPVLEDIPEQVSRESSTIDSPLELPPESNDINDATNAPVLEAPVTLPETAPQEDEADSQVTAAADDTAVVTRVFDLLRLWGDSMDKGGSQSVLEAIIFQNLHTSIAIEDIPTVPVDQAQRLDELDPDENFFANTDEFFL